MKLIPELCKVSNDQVHDIPYRSLPSSNSGTDQQGLVDSSPTTSWVEAGRPPLVLDEEAMGCKGEREEGEGERRLAFDGSVGCGMT